MSDAQIPLSAVERQLLATWEAEHQRAMHGWSFEQLGDALVGTPLPWDFERWCRAELSGLGAHTLVGDMGTGGGERLVALLEQLRRTDPAERTFVLEATEGWAPNVGVAATALEPYGVRVHACDPERDPLPWPDGSVDVLMNRHEAFDAAEVARVLRPGGVFLTQQVGSGDNGEIRELLGSPATELLSEESLTDELTAAGLLVVGSGSDTGTYTFRDVAAVVGYLALVPWEAPTGFSPSRYAELMLELHREHTGEQGSTPIVSRQERCWVRAVAPS